MNTYEIVFNYDKHTKNVVAETASKAKYKLFLELQDCFDCTFKEFLGFIKCKTLGKFKPEDLFGDEEQFDRMKEMRDIPFAYMGMKIEVCGKMVTIVGSNGGLNLNVVKDGTCYIDNCHPWYKTKYFDSKGNVIREYGA
jgi:hypothetical protein